MSACYLTACRLHPQAHRILLSALVEQCAPAQAAGEGQRNPPRVLIFVNRIKTARFVAGEVSAAGFRTALLHGDRPQGEREVILSCLGCSLGLRC